ncbi:MAG TPA: ATP-binding protein, partial [Candidatus Nanopelagicales bacterium]|nr:ATP-binding protein [Candidatus Nanopelagicales bacterium]
PAPTARIHSGAPRRRVSSSAALAVLRAAGYPPGTLEPGQRVDVLPGSAREDTLRRGAPLWIRAVGAGCEDCAPLPIAGAPPRACSLVPLTAGGRTLGLLALSFDAPQPFADDDRELILAMAGECAQALERARLHHEARDADRRKDEFLAMLSHELRNPLAPMLMGLELLRRRAAGTPLDRTAAVVQRQALTITRLVDDLLDVSRVTRGNIALQPERLDLAAVITSSVETARPLLQERRHDITVELSPGLQVEGDRVRLEQVLTNLLNNAGKYTDPGGRIAIRSTRADDEALITVIDNGLGVAPDVLPHIFDPFMQARRSLDRSQGGLGIGLTLVKRLVEMHGGRVEARSEGPGLGTELRVHLPLAEASETVPAIDRLTPVNDTPLPAAPSGLQVLVVDDNLDAAESLEAMLHDLGHAVTLAHDGPTALATAAASAPDLILLDIGLPGMDGYEVVRRLRAQPAFTGTRIVAVSGYGQAEDLRRSAEAGFDQHLIKPANARVLAEIAASVKALRRR